MKFEFDPHKSRTNRLKHGIDFHLAQQLWVGPSVEFAARHEFENRFAIIGPIERKLYTCIFTMRGETIRLISCRRARTGEVRLYEKAYPTA